MNESDANQIHNAMIKVEQPEIDYDLLYDEAAGEYLTLPASYVKVLESVPYEEIGKYLFKVKNQDETV